MKRNGLRACKPTQKSGLTEAMMKARYHFCMRYKNWTLKNWKKVIWIDETSVILGSRRGKTRVWRTLNEVHDKTCTRRRFKGFSEFMWWSSFSYDKKDLYHIWKAETAAQKKASVEELKRINDALEPTAKEAWELETFMRRMGLRNKAGPKPKWKWDQNHDKVVRKDKGGIDWYRYQKEILLPKLIPFARECMIDRPNTLVQKDKASAHASKHQDVIFMNASILRLLWPANSPDLNAIEPCWWWMKRQTIRKGAPRSRIAMTKTWTICWNKELSQERIQKWIRRISRHIQQIIEVEGDNDYREGRSEGDIRPYNRTDRKERYQRRKAGRRPGGSEVDVDEVVDEVEVDEVEAEEEVDEEDW